MDGDFKNVFFCVIFLGGKLLMAQLVPPPNTIFSQT